MMPLSALLSQAWTAFTIEVDNAFEARLPHRTTRGGGPRSGPWLVSQAMWWSCLKHVADSPLPIGEMERRARMRTNLPGLVRWGYVTLDPKPPASRAARPPADTLVQATPVGYAACAVWAPLLPEIEARWEARMGGGEMARLRLALERMDAELPSYLPDCMPILGFGLRASLLSEVESASSNDSRAESLSDARIFDADAVEATGSNAVDGVTSPSLPARLARKLLSITLQYEKRTGLSLAIGSNLLRLVDGQSIRLRDVPLLAGVSKEAVDTMVSHLERNGLSVVSTQGGARILTLTEAGLTARSRHDQALSDVESRWRQRWGGSAIDELRASLESMVTGERGAAFLAECLAVPSGGWRKSQSSLTLPWQPMVLHRGGFPDGA